MFSHFTEETVSGMDGQLAASVWTSAAAAGLIAADDRNVSEMRFDAGMQLREASHNLMLAVHRETVNFPADELNGITGALRSAAVLIGTSISEGFRRRGETGMSEFFKRALGYALQLEYQLLRAFDLGYFGSVSQANLARQVVETKRLLAACIKSLEESGESSRALAVAS